MWAIWLIGLFYLFTLVLGFGAAAAGRPEGDHGGARQGVTPRTAARRSSLGGTVLLASISAVAFATILAVVAGLTITASTSFAHDIYASIIKKGEIAPDGEVRVARIAPRS